MCYPWIDRSLPPQEVDEKGARSFIWQSLEEDFPEAVRFLAEMSEKVLGTGKKLIRSEDPDSKLGQELKEILGSDVNRSVLSEFACHGLAIGFYHCCSLVMARTPNELELSAREHLEVYRQTRSLGTCST